MKTPSITATNLPLFTHPTDCGEACTGEDCTAVQFMCRRCGVHGFGDHCAETEEGAPVALCFNHNGWVTGRFTDL